MSGKKEGGGSSTIRTGEIVIEALQKKIKTETTRIKNKKTAKASSAATQTKVTSKGDTHSIVSQPACSNVTKKVTSISVPKVSIEVKSMEMYAENRVVDSVFESITTQGIAVISKSMTITQLKEECRVRDPKAKGLSTMKKAQLLEILVEGSEVEGSREWKKKKKEEILKKHVHKSLCHHHLLANPRNLPAPSNVAGSRSHKKRFECAVCDVNHQWLCDRTPYRSCAQCDFDICAACYEIESLPSAEKELLLKCKYDRIKRDQEERARKYREQQQELQERRRRREEETQRRIEEETRNIPALIKCPPPANLDPDNKLKFSVWTSCGYECDGWHSYEGPPRKTFNSSYDTLKEANQRVEYVFYYENPWGLKKEEMQVDSDTIKSKGVRFMTSRPDDSERWTVSAMPSIAFDYINDVEVEHEAVRSFF